jgi:hypothetical protein
MPPVQSLADHHLLRAPTRRRLLLGAATTALGSAGSARAVDEPTLVRYPPPEVQPDQRNDYEVRLLTLALAKAGGRFLPARAGTSMTKGRAIIELAHGGSGLDVLWAMTNPERERLLRPVRIPIDRGLIGWRLCLLRRQDEHLLRGVDSAAALGHFVAGKGHDWPDLRILRANGLSTTAVNSYPALFGMLARGRFDYLPRSVIELGGERGLIERANLVLDPYLVLHYPAALYFFVHRERADLADALQLGLERAQADGSFEALFRTTHEPQLRAAQLTQRRVIELVNPLLPESAPTQRRELWWQVSAEAPPRRTPPPAANPRLKGGAAPSPPD